MTSRKLPYLVLLAAFAMTTACSNFRTYTEAERKEHLERGEILSYLKNIQGTDLAIGESQAIIDAPPKRVWNCVTDYNRQSEIGPRTKKIEITRIEGDVAYVDMILDAPWPMDDAVFSLKVDHDKKAYRTNWNLVEGNIRETYGSWDIDPIPGEPNRSLVTYTLLYDDGRDIPRSVVNTATRKAVRDIMGVLRNHIHDPVYDRPIYSISVLDSGVTGTDFVPPNNSAALGERNQETVLDEATQETLR